MVALRWESSSRCCRWLALLRGGPTSLRAATARPASTRSTQPSREQLDAGAPRGRARERALRDRPAYEREERERLAPRAVQSADDAGAGWSPEPEHAYRTAFQRDRDRIVHSRAFRRLEYKTQVFVYHEGDHHRNRLTHTLEASQIARTLARILRLNEELAEAIVLAHDLGHTPFGHAGERVLVGPDEVLRRLRPQPPEPAHRRPARGALPGLPRAEPHLRDARGHPEARLPTGTTRSPVPASTAQPCARGAGGRPRRRDRLHQPRPRRRSALRPASRWSSSTSSRSGGETRRRVRDRRHGDVRERILRAQTIIALINQLVTDLARETARPTRPRRARRRRRACARCRSGSSDSPTRGERSSPS